MRRHLTPTLALAACAALFSGSRASADRGGNDDDEDEGGATLKGMYMNSQVQFCNYTAAPDVPGGPTAINNQRVGVFGTSRFDGAGGLTVRLTSHNFNVPAGTRSTVRSCCHGTYTADTSDIVTTQAECISETIEGAGKGNKTWTHNIKGRFLRAGRTLFRLPDGPPEEETVDIKPLVGSPSTQYRKCTRVGNQEKIQETDEPRFECPVW